MATGVKYIAITGGPETVGIDAEYRPEAASQIFKAGALLVRSGANVQEAAANPTTGLAGFAINDGQDLTAAGDKQAGFRPIRPGVRFRGTLDGTLAVATQIGATVAAVKDGTTERWYFKDGGATGTVEQFRIIDIDPRFANGDTDAVVIVEPLDEDEYVTVP